MARYIHQLEAWPRFRWNIERISDRLAAVSRRQGLLIGRMQGLGFALRDEAGLASLTEEVMKSSEIEGERLDRDQVRWSRVRRIRRCATSTICSGAASSPRIQLGDAARAIC